MVEYEEVSRAHTRALLIGADTFLGDDRLLHEGQARAGLDAVAGALTHYEYGVVPRMNLSRLLAPRYPAHVEHAVRRAARHTRDLLILYYVGHGWLLDDKGKSGDRLYLTVAASDPEHIRSSAVALDDLVDWALSGRTQRVVLILDTCYSGNLAGHLDPKDRHLSVLTSAPQRRRVSAGEGGPTPFTAALVKVLLRDVAPDEYPAPDKELTVARLGRALRRQQEKQPADTVFPWEAQERSFGEGAATVIARRGPGPAPAGRADPGEAGVHRGPARAGEGSGSAPPVPPLLARIAGRCRRWCVRLWRRFRDGSRAPVTWAFGPGRPLWHRMAGWLTLVVLVTAAAWSGVSRPWAAPPPPCPPPIELRLDTAPEEAGAMAEIADAYEDRAFGDGCRTSRVSVHATALDTLADALGTPGWGTGTGGLLREAGPQPDLWFAQSSADLTYADSTLGGSGARLGRPVRVARDQQVVAVTERGRTALGLPRPRGDGQDSTDWKTLRKGLDRAGSGSRLLRPNPTVSGTGLAQFLGMAHDYDSGQPERSTYDNSTPQLTVRELADLEREVIGRGEPVTDGADALCRLLTRRAAGGDDYVGALTTLRQTELPYTENCPGPLDSRKLLTYRIKGAPPLDHPLVAIDWDSASGTSGVSGASGSSGTAGATRAKEIRRFSTWLSSKAAASTLRSLHYTPTDGGAQTVRLSGGDLDATLDTFRAAHPALRVTVLFDVSGSMGEGGKFPAAKEAVARALDTLGSDATYRVQLFPRDDKGRGSTVVGGDWRLSATTAPPVGAADVREGREADLLGALTEARETIASDASDTLTGDEPRQYAILLVTDGDYLKGKAPRVGALKAEAEKLGADRVQVHVAAMRPEGCVAGREPLEVARASGGSCSRLSGSLDSELAEHLAPLAQGRRR